MARETLRFCNNERCPSYQIPFTFGKQKRCQECGWKTTFIQDDFDNNFRDMPPASFVNVPPNGASSKLVILNPRPTEPDKPLTFTSSCDLQGCPVAPDSLPVHMPFAIYNQGMYLAQKFEVEWIAYITGALVDGTYMLDETGLYFPPQLASGATVVPTGILELKENTIACIHSHVDFKAIFSDVDWKHFNSPVEMVINRYGEMDCVTRVKLDCGRFERVKSKVTIIGSGQLQATAEALAAQLTIKKQPQQTRGTIYASDRPTTFSSQASVSSCANRGTPVNQTSRIITPNEINKDYQERGNPPDKLVQVAINVLQRRIHHEHLTGTRTEAHDPAAN